MKSAGKAAWPHRTSVECRLG